MVQIIAHTPPWVFGLLLALILLGLQQRKNRRVKKPLAFFLPLGMTALSFAGVFTSFGFDWKFIAIWVIGLGVCALTTTLWLPTRGIQYHTENSSFCIPGSWLPLLVIMAIFMTKYSVGVMQGLSPDSLNSVPLKMTLSLVYGLLSGYFVGRAACLWLACQNNIAQTVIAKKNSET